MKIRMMIIIVTKVALCQDLNLQVKGLATDIGVEPDSTDSKQRYDNNPKIEFNNIFPGQEKVTEKQPEDISQTASNLFLSTFMGAQRTEAPVVRSTLSKMVVVTMASNNLQEETRGNFNLSKKFKYPCVISPVETISSSTGSS